MLSLCLYICHQHLHRIIDRGFDLVELLALRKCRRWRTLTGQAKAEQFDLENEKHISCHKGCHNHRGSIPVSIFLLVHRRYVGPFQRPAKNVPLGSQDCATDTRPSTNLNSPRIPKQSPGWPLACQESVQLGRRLELRSGDSVSAYASSVAMALEGRTRTGPDVVTSWVSC